MGQTLGKLRKSAKYVSTNSKSRGRAITDSPQERANAMSAIAQRRMIGILGVILPLLCYGYSLLRPFQWLPSISHYYYTPVHGEFIAILCGLGMVLYVYRGYDSWDKWATSIAAVFALCVGLFPAARGTLSLPDLGPLFIDSENMNGNIHDASATGLFLMFFFISAFLFTRRPRDPKSEPSWGEFFETLRGSYGFLITPRHRNNDVHERDNKIHRRCAWVILLSIIGAAWTSFSHKGQPLPFFFGLFETAAIWAFACSWLVKNRWKRYR